MTIKLRAVVVAALFVLSLSACAHGVKSPAATVNGHDISDEDVEASVPLFEFLGSVQQGTCGNPERGERESAACARFVLQRLIEEELVVEYADQRNLSVPKAELEDTFSGLKDQLGSRFGSLLDQHGLTERDVKAFIERLLLFRSMESNLADDAVSEDDLRQAYEERKLEFTNTIHAWHILVDDRDLAERIAAEATPDNFAELAAKYSQDPGSKDKGGDLGTVPASQFVPEFAEAAVALEPGEISDPVQTQFGWHVIRLIDADVASFEEVHDFLARDLAGDVLSRWIEQRLEGSDIEVNPRYGRLNAKKREITPIHSTATESPEATPSGSAPSASVTS